MKKYKLLKKEDDENIELIREYALARTEKTKLYKRIDDLEEVLADHSTLSKYVWTTDPGECIPIADIKDDHLENIVKHLAERGATNGGIEEEYQKRFGKDSGLKPTYASYYAPEDYDF